MNKQYNSGCVKCGNYPQFTQIFIEKYNDLCRWCTLSKEEQKQIQEHNQKEIEREREKERERETIKNK